MTSISEAFETPAVAAERPTAVKAAAVVAGSAYGRWARRLATTASADVRQAWVWHGRPPNLVDLWAARVPSLNVVPGGSKALHVAWVVFNHVALVLYAFAAVPLWVLGHPARALLAAAVAAPLFALWIL